MEEQIRGSAGPINPQAVNPQAVNPQAADPHAGYRPRRITRDAHDYVLGGVAAGVAEHLGLPTAWVRAGFVVASFAAGLGVAFYAALWLLVPSNASFESSTPGLDSAARDGRRPGRQRRFSDHGPAVLVVVLALGVALLLQAVFGAGGWVFPALLAAVGVALVWRQADEAQRERWLDDQGRLSPRKLFFARDSWWRVAIGVILVLVALGTFALSQGGFAAAREVWLATLLGIAGLAVVVGPWVFRLASDLGAERAERIRSQERADMAAHLHDSVLQTLALIQRNADDPVAVARLARGQERELRAWLFAADEPDDTTLAGALRDAMASVEAEHAITVDVITVGDSDSVEHVRTVVAAAREAVVNAAKHAQVSRVDVYAECTSAAIEVFVRDRGAGFDPDAVGEDRMGVRSSIVGRMERHGGQATVRSSPGQGTEVKLVMPLKD